MAIYTELSLEDATRLSIAHGLPAPRAVVGVAAGSVNSNFFLESEAGRVFARVYEEQDTDGVAFEWALLSHLAARGLPVPKRIDGPEPGAVRVFGKPTALFEVLPGHQVCQAMVDAGHAEAVGAVLARAHHATEDFGRRRAGRFTRADLRVRLDDVASRRRPELEEPVERLRRTLDDVDAAWDPALPSGTIHGDLFRDNVHWVDKTICGVLDWESASDGPLVYDLAVAVLAWCYGDDFDWALARAMVRGYAGVRALTPGEAAAVRPALMAAAARFTTTRITDFHLREGAAQVSKDWRRFMARLDAVQSLEPAELRARLLV